MESVVEHGRDNICNKKISRVKKVICILLQRLIAIAMLILFCFVEIKTVDDVVAVCMGIPLMIYVLFTRKNYFFYF